MQRDAKRAERFIRALGPEWIRTLMVEWTAIGNGHPPRTSSFENIAVVARKARISPEVMLGAMRFISRSIFPHGTSEHDRIEEAWHPSVRVLINAYYDSAQTS